jgi:hypothetical protein
MNELESMWNDEVVAWIKVLLSQGIPPCLEQDTNPWSDSSKGSRHRVLYTGTANVIFVPRSVISRDVCMSACDTLLVDWLWWGETDVSELRPYGPHVDHGVMVSTGANS